MSTETVDPRYDGIDLWPTSVAVSAMLEGQLAAIGGLMSQVEAIAAAADAAAQHLRAEGRLVYAGAGTSGRIAVQDGVELIPTYAWPEERLVFLLAGGETAITQAVEGAEDDTGAAVKDAAAAQIGPDDVVIGVAASGRTPYTVALLQEARRRGALTVGLANNPETPLLAAADFPLLADTGAECVAGSTRMKAGTAQKVVLNLLSTAIMLRGGCIYRGMMVDMRASNVKLKGRARRMVATLAGVDEAQAEEALRMAGEDIKRAVLVASGATPDEAEARLAAAHGNLRLARGEAGSGESFHA